MDIKFDKWNAGTGEPWVYAHGFFGTVSMTVEEAREFALDIIMRAWHRDKVRELINELKKFS